MLRRDRMQAMALGGLAFGSLLGVPHTTRGCGIIAGVGAVGSGSGVSGSLDVCVQLEEPDHQALESMRITTCTVTYHR